MEVCPDIDKVTQGITPLETVGWYHLLDPSTTAKLLVIIYYSSRIKAQGWYNGSLDTPKLSRCVITTFDNRPQAAGRSHDTMEAIKWSDPKEHDQDNGQIITDEWSHLL